MQEIIANTEQPGSPWNSPVMTDITFLAQSLSGAVLPGAMGRIVIVRIPNPGGPYLQKGRDAGTITPGKISRLRCPEFFFVKL
jgi:hypothetical protein